MGALDPGFFEQGLEALLFSLILSTSRPLGFILILPLFTRFGLRNGILQGAVMIAFAIPVFPGVMHMVTLMPSLDFTTVALLVAKEVFLGVLLGLILGIPFWAIMAAGDMIDMQRGASMATLLAPGTGEQTTVTGTLFFLIAVFVLIISGWFTQVLLRTLYESYAPWPVLRFLPDLTPDAGALALELLDALFATGLMLAIPILGPLLLTELAMGIAGKFMPQINILDLAMSVKQVIFLVLLSLYLSAFLYYIEVEVRDLGATLDTLRAFLAPPSSVTDPRSP